jgi:hypothetical protein
MLKELRSFNSLGTPSYFWEVLELFYNQPNTDWSKDSIDAHFKGRIIDGKDVFDGGLQLLELADVLEVDITGFYHTTYSFRQRLHSQEHCRGRVLEALLKAMKEDDDTYAIFSTEFCSFDFVNNVIQIEKSAFGLQYGNIRDVLISIGFLLPHPNYPERSFAINRSHRNLFDRHFTAGIRKRRISPDQLRSIQEQQQENGLLGEKFVYDFEGIRTKRESEIEWVASYDTTAGFDIMSFESNTSVNHDRFIEVKAYSGDAAYFYWSRNEMQVAETKGRQYFLYLVNLDEVENPNYNPTIIKNPAIEILKNSDWQKTVDKFHIVYVGL